MVDPESVKTFLRRRFSREEVVGLYFTVAVLACLALLVGFGILTEEVFETRVGTNPVDKLVGTFLYGLRGPGLTRFFRAVTELGGFRFLAVVTPLAGIALWLAGHRVSAFLFLGSVVGGFAVSSVFKILFARARPDLWQALVQEKTYSFPSGHSTMATVFFGGLVAVAFHLSRERRVRGLALTGGVPCVLCVAVSRVYLGAHWATDTAAGILVGLFWVIVFAAGTELLLRRRPASPGGKRTR